jgi:DDE superfamily endonuclease
VTIDESGALLAPLVKRTLAPKGQTPVIRQRAKHRQKISMIAGLTCSPVRRRLRLFFALHKNLSFNSQRVRWFLGQLLKHIKGKLFVIWDNGMMHRGPVIQQMLRRTRRVELFRLPPYAPDCDPVELVWSNLKAHRMANYVPQSIDHLYRAARAHLNAIAADQEALAGCFNGSRLGLPRPVRGTLTG